MNEKPKKLDEAIKEIHTAIAQIVRDTGEPVLKVAEAARDYLNDCLKKGVFK